MQESDALRPGDAIGTTGRGGADSVSATPIAVPTGETGPRVEAPCGPVRGVWRRIVSASRARPPHTRFERSAAFYGIPDAIARQALACLTQEMRDVVIPFIAQRPIQLIR